MNEERHVVPFYEELKKVFDGLDGYDFEVIFVDDGSKDETLGRVKKMGFDDPRVKGISFSRNFGHQAALTAGLKHATGDAAITMDCDFQHPPELIPDFVKL
ncbi:MAG: glycosyltransferase family 2 protein, partial [Verrucomicrobiota bacterium]